MPKGKLYLPSTQEAIFSLRVSVIEKVRRHKELTVGYLSYGCNMALYFNRSVFAHFQCLLGYGHGDEVPC